MNRRMRRVAAAGMTGALLALAGCSGEPDEVVTVDNQPHPVVTPGQAQTILATIDASLRAGVPTGDKAQLGQRAVGPFRDIALADALAAGKLKTKATVPSSVSNAQLFVPVTGGWPRFFIAAGTASGQATPVLRVLSSATPRVPYGLWASLSVLPGASVPPIAEASTGTAQLAPNATGLVATPSEVATRYVDLLVRGTGSRYAAQFNADEFSRQVVATLKADQVALRKTGTVYSTHTVQPQGLLSLRTRDGGALVIASLQQVYTIDVKAGRPPIRITDRSLAALAGKPQFTKRFTRTSAEIVAFVIPPAGQGKITVVAGDKGTTTVKAT